MQASDDQVLVPRDKLQGACNAWRNMLTAWSKLRLDTAEDQALHDELVNLTKRSVDAVSKVAWRDGFCDEHWSWLCARGQGECGSTDRDEARA